MENFGEYEKRLESTSPLKEYFFFSSPSFFFTIESLQTMLLRYIHPKNVAKNALKSHSMKLTSADDNIKNFQRFVRNIQSNLKIFDLLKT